MHEGADDGHSVPPAGVVCADCHTGSDLPAIHATAQNAASETSCFVCHGSTGPPNTNDCTVCHFTFEAHYDSIPHTSTSNITNCDDSGCHGTNDLMGAHVEKNAAFECADCHDSARLEVIAAIADGDTACGTCHTGVTEASGHYLVHGAIPPLEDAAGPNYGYWTGSASTQPTGDCAGCHTSNLVDEHIGIAGATPGTWIIKPRYDSRGQALDCAACHTSLDGSVQSAIALGFTGCDACHVVHAPINGAHTSSFAAAPEVDCAPCHDDNLVDEHNGGYTTTTPSGKRLTGCDVCHANYESPRGPLVQDAISVTNTTLCTACHAAAHPDLGSHEATTAASLACGGSACHGTGSPTPIDIKAVHAQVSGGPCVVCHSPGGRVPDITSETGECASCHASQGVDYHRDFSATHATTSDSADCFTPCHPKHSSATVISDVRIHRDGCSACHNDTFDLTGKTARCVDCHGEDVGQVPIHREYSVRHVASTVASDECTACHDSDIKDTHVASPLGCSLCHATVAQGGQADCRFCHTTHGPGFSNPLKVFAIGECGNVACHGELASVIVTGTAGHYTANAESHAATTEDSSCSDCHSMDLKMAHEAVSDACATCHNSAKFAALNGSWDGTCTSCHTTIHAAAVVGHTTLSSGCTGSPGCHPATTLPENHALYAGPGSANPQFANSCVLCHKNPAVDVENAGSGGPCDGCHQPPAGQYGNYHWNQDHHASAPSSDECVRCHGAGLPSVNRDWVVALHNADGSTSGGTWDNCATCHNNPARGGDLSNANTSNCLDCHAVSGTDYHSSMDASHTATSMDSGCLAPECHVSASLPQEHARFLSRYPEYVDTCALCHLNADSGRIDWTSASADCSACHEVHGDLDGIHQAPGSQMCVDCHETTDVRDLHPECSTCHNATVDTSGTTACANCHTKTPLDPAHYPAASHLATETGCDSCHLLDMKTEHAKPSAGAVTCVQCHEGKVDSFMAGWNRSCMACHETKHTAQAAKHVSTNSACAGSGCHVVVDVSAIHAGLVGGGCPTCHTSASSPATTTDCSAAGCHATYHVTKPTKHRATSVASADCARCHDLNADVGTDIEPVHIGAAAGPCAVCHANTARVPDITTKSAECASCHATTGSDYHRTMNVQHTFSGFGASCIAAGCHVSASLPQEHARFLSRYPAYSDTCALCHLNTSPTRIDWNTASADCSTCHTVHGDIDAIHQAPGSGECSVCHETTDVRTIHAAGCATCHNATVDTSGTTACAGAGCHASYSPPSPTKHYTAAPHLATETGCGNCHSMDMKTEHFKTSSGPVTCVQCHENKVDGFTTVWNKTCAACHATKHAAQATKHASTNTSCAGAGCHNIADASDVHKGLQGGGCSVCHKNATSPATTTDCSSAGCHAGMGTNHHAAHDGNLVNGAGCEGCHFRHLDDEHAALGLTCATCHASTATDVVTAIATHDRRCLSCHHDSAHNARQTVEFGAGNASMHRVAPGLPGMRSSFLVNGSTYTMALPAASSFLKTGYTYDTMLSCASCHTYSGAVGPHGATMKVNIDPAYPADWKTAYLSSSSSGMAISGNSTASNVLCSKCHDLRGTSFSNEVHDVGDHDGSSDGTCILCHVKVPHGWGRPRLLGYTTDPEPYRTTGLRQVKLRSYTPFNWSESDCAVACGEHDGSLTPAWPNVMSMTPGPTTGILSGTVTAASGGAAISGATLTLGTATATSSTNGTYSLASVTPGTYTLTVAKTGYTTYSGSVTVIAGQTTTANVALQASSTSTNLLLNKTFSASRYESSSYTPAKASDGLTATWWWSDNNGGSYSTEWLTGDVGSRTAISKVEVAWNGSYYAREFRVYTSTDASSWTQVYSTTSGVAGTTVVTFAARDARYVKVECRRTGSGGSNGYGIAELRAFQ